MEDGGESGDMIWPLSIIYNQGFTAGVQTHYPAEDYSCGHVLNPHKWGQWKDIGRWLYESGEITPYQQRECLRCKLKDNRHG